MASSLPIRGLLRHSASPSPLLFHHRPSVLALPPSQHLLASLFSTSVSNAAGPPEPTRSVPYNWLKVKRIRKSNKSKTPKRVRVPTSKRPRSGDRKRFRKRIVLSNTSALTVPNLPELQPDTLLSVPKRALSRQDAHAQRLTTLVAGLNNGSWAPGEKKDIVSIAKGMVAIPGPLVDQLRKLEAFKPSQSWGLFKKPHFLVREETVQLVGRMDRAVREKQALRMVIEGKGGTGKSILLLQAISHALMNKWVVINIPEGE